MISFLLKIKAYPRRILSIGFQKIKLLSENQKTLITSLEGVKEKKLNLEQKGYYYNYTEKAFKLFKVNDVFLFGEDALLASKNGDLLVLNVPKERENEAIFLNAYSILFSIFQKTFVNFKKSKKIRFVLSSNWDNFGHFIVEDLPRLYFLLTNFDKLNVNEIQIITNKKLPKWKIDFLKKILGKDERFKIVNWEGKIVKVDMFEVSFPPICKETVFYAKKMLESNLNTTEIKKSDILFLGRDHKKFNYACVNESSIISELKNSGKRVTYIEPSKHTLEEQILYVKGAKTIIGFYGSNLSLFCLLEKHQKIVFLYTTRNHFGFQQYAVAAGINSTQVFISKFKEYRNKNFLIEKSEVDKIARIVCKQHIKEKKGI